MPNYFKRDLKKFIDSVEDLKNLRYDNSEIDRWKKRLFLFLENHGLEEKIHEIKSIFYQKIGGMKSIEELSGIDVRPQREFIKNISEVKNTLEILLESKVKNVKVVKVQKTTNNRLTKGFNWTKWGTIFAGLAVLIAVLPYIGFYPLNISEKIIDKNDETKFFVTLGKVIFSNASQNPNYRSYVPIEIETYTKNPSRIFVKLVNVTYDPEINKYLSKSLNLPDSFKKYNVSLKVYTQHTNQGYNKSYLRVPIEINKLWIDPHYLGWRSKFNIGIGRLRIDLMDIAAGKNITNTYEFAMIWNNK